MDEVDWSGFGDEQGCGPAEVSPEVGLPDTVPILAALMDPAGLTDAFSPVPACVRDMDLTYRDGQVCFHMDRGSDILAVAHLDAVQRISTPRVSGGVLRSTGIDDRLGVHIITNVLPQLGIETDVLLTSDEEMGRSSGAIFHPPGGRRYKMMLEFDREGHLPVLYQYDTPGFRRVLQGFAIGVNIGSYSDIMSMRHLGCPGINLPTACSHGHKPHAQADLTVTALCVARASRFIREFVIPTSREGILEAVEFDTVPRGDPRRRSSPAPAQSARPEQSFRQEIFDFAEQRGSHSLPPAHPDINNPDRGEFF